jgi:hypothetical protein
MFYTYIMKKIGHLAFKMQILHPVHTFAKNLKVHKNRQMFKKLN